MSETKDGGPAFPAEGPSKGQFENPGMTLRDWFAGQALSLFYWQRPDPKVEESGQQAIARQAYSVADAMIAEREQRQIPNVE